MHHVAAEHEITPCLLGRVHPLVGYLDQLIPAFDPFTRILYDPDARRYRTTIRRRPKLFPRMRLSAAQPCFALVLGMDTPNYKKQ